MKSLFLLLFLPLTLCCQEVTDQEPGQWTIEGGHQEKKQQIQEKKAKLQKAHQERKLKPVLEGEEVAEEHKTPEQIEMELQDAEAQFLRAKEMFNPWYTGPLITPSASMMPPGYGNFQPYIFMVGNYAHYDVERKSVSLPDNLYQFISSNILQFGVTKTMDIIVVLTAEGQWEAGKSGGGFGDVPITLGWPIVLQTLYVPQIKFSVQETFPTGRYQHLNSNGLALSGIGGGSYQTQFSLTFGKTILWTYCHPMNLRLFFGYNIPSKVHVEGFNVYGGGFGTRGTVRPGNTFKADLGIEWSVNQPWVLCFDIVYSASNRTTFSGRPGTLRDGTPAAVGGGYSDNLSLAPGFEYNWNENLGIVAGTWFSVYGRNSLAFVQGIFSVCWTFKVN